MARTFTAKEMAAQYANPQGEIGLLFGQRMNRLNQALYATLAAGLQPEPGMRLLEIGFANGHFIPDLLRLAEKATYAGIDISETMAAAAADGNRAAVAAGTVQLTVASVMDIPFAAGSFDRALAVNTLYFWPDALRGLQEIRRVLKTNGRLALAARTPDSAAQSDHTQHGYRLYDRETLLQLTAAAGFRRTDVRLYEEMVPAVADEAAWQRTSYLVFADA